MVINENSSSSYLKAAIIHGMQTSVNEMNKKQWILLRNSFKDRGQITLLDKKAAEDSQDLTAAPATETLCKKLDAGEEAHTFWISRCKCLAMLMFFSAYL